MAPATLSRNLYAETAAPGPELPPLAGETRADVAIVGGGYTGLSTALHLAEADLSAVLVEAEGIGHGCSGRNGGQVNPGLKPDPDQIELDHGPGLGARMVALSYGAPDELFELVERHGIACAPCRSGTLRAAIDAPSERGLVALAGQCARRGMPVELLNAARTRELTGTGRYRSALLDPRGGHLNPLAYARGLARAALDAGARLHAGSPARSVERVGQGWRVTTPQGSVTAPHLVVATNGYTGDLWPGLRRTIVPVHSAITATLPLPPALRAQIMPGRSSLYELGWTVVYYRLDEAGRLLMGGRGPQRESRGPADCRHLVAYAERLWPELKGVSWPYHWSGQVALTADHYPQLTEPAPGVHLALGYNGRGVAMATVMGRLLAERIASGGAARIDLPVHRALMPIAFHRFRRLGIEARLLYGRLRDRVGS